MIRFLFLPGQSLCAHIFYWNLDSLSLLITDNCRNWWETAFDLNLCGILHILCFYGKRKIIWYLCLNVTSLPVSPSKSLCWPPENSPKMCKSHHIDKVVNCESLILNFSFYSKKECCSLNCKEHFTQSQQHNEDKEGGGLSKHHMP